MPKTHSRRGLTVAGARRYLLTACWVLWLLPGPGLSQQFRREEVIAAYLFNFAKNIEWRNEGGIAGFNFLIISDDAAINREMTDISAAKKIKGKRIKVTLSESVSIPKDVQLIYITRGLKELAEPVFRRIEGQNILLVTDGVDDKRVIMINLIRGKDQTLKFEINKANILNQGLAVLPDMVLLGGTEIDVAKLYKESQDTLRTKENRIAALQRHLDSLDAQIRTIHTEIDSQRQVIQRQNQSIQNQDQRIRGQDQLIRNQNQDILGQQLQLRRQRDTLSRRADSLARSQVALLSQQNEIARGKSVLTDQQERIEGQNASILRQKKVLDEQNLTIAVQENIQRLLILAIALVSGLSYAIYRGYKGKKRSNRLLHEQADKIQKLNRDLRERAIALETANRELEAFSYSVSHDLRAPLRSIDGFSQAFIEDYGSGIDERGKDYLRRVRSAAQRMAHLIDDMLNLARVTRNEMVFRETNLSRMAEDIADRLRKLQPDRRTDFRIQSGMTARGDENLLRIALENLFDNAWKYTSKHPAAVIEFGSMVSAGERHFFVKDDGAGFDMKYAQKMFGAFQRMHTIDEFPGSGVGLATVQRIIHRHGGRIWAESEVEKGATFRFTIPSKEESGG